MGFPGLVEFYCDYRKILTDNINVTILCNRILVVPTCLSMTISSSQVVVDTKSSSSSSSSIMPLIIICGLGTASSLLVYLCVREAIGEIVGETVIGEAVGF